MSPPNDRYLTPPFCVNVVPAVTTPRPELGWHEYCFCVKVHSDEFATEARMHLSRPTATRDSHGRAEYVCERIELPPGGILQQLYTLPSGAESNAWIDWRYRANPGGPAECWGMVERARSEVGSVFSIIPRPFLWRGQVLRGGLAVDLATDAAHRRRGLATRVIRGMFDGAARLGYDVVLGFPNAASLPAHRKEGGWTEVGNIRIDVVTANPIARFATGTLARVYESSSQVPRTGILPSILRAATSPSLPSLDMALSSALLGKNLSRTLPGPVEYARFAERYEASADGVHARDFQWHLWRFYTTPQVGHVAIYARDSEDLNGYVVLREIRTEHRGLVAAVVDLRSLDCQTEKRLLRGALRYARLRGAGAVTLPRLNYKPNWGALRPKTILSESVVIARSPSGILKPSELTSLQILQSDSDMS